MAISGNSSVIYSLQSLIICLFIHLVQIIRLLVKIIFPFSASFLPGVFL